jgi:hypothetical protein
VGLVGRPDLAERGAALSEAEIGQVSQRASEILASSSPKDLGRAIGLAAVEFLTVHDRSTLLSYVLIKNMPYMYSSELFSVRGKY